MDQRYSRLVDHSDNRPFRPHDQAVVRIEYRAQLTDPVPPLDVIYPSEYTEVTCTIDEQGHRPGNPQIVDIEHDCSEDRPGLVLNGR